MEGANSLSKGKLWAGELFYAPCLTVAGGGGSSESQTKEWTPSWMVQGAGEGFGAGKRLHCRGG